GGGGGGVVLGPPATRDPAVLVGFDRCRQLLLRGRGGHRLRTHDLAQFFDRATQRVDLVLEGRERAIGGGIGGRHCAQRVVANLRQASSVVFFGDVAAEKFARADV